VTRARSAPAIKFSAKIVVIKFIGTHAEYDRIGPASISRF
jgi:mRNA-degrading endonuclease HigB of HigAB toxin-antitoxin module